MRVDVWCAVLPRIAVRVCVSNDVERCVGRLRLVSGWAALRRVGSDVSTMSGGRTFQEQVIEEFRANAGVVGGVLAGNPTLLLTTTGRKSGQPRVAPLTYVADDASDDLLIVASKGGAPTHPDWFHNLLAQPQVTVEVGSEVYTATASVVSGAERARLFAMMAAQVPGFAVNQEKTTRELPVVRLTRQGR